MLLWKIRQVLADFPRDYQILVANDGSSDDTAEVLSPYQRVLPLTVVRIEKRTGYANALELLVREAVRRAEYPKRDVIVTLQADFTDDPAELTPMLKKIEAGADVVCVNSKIPQSASRTVRWGNKIGRFLLRRRDWPEGVTDPLSGLRVYRVLAVKRAIEARGPERLLTWEGWAANAELLQLVQPHARRTEAVEALWRGERHQRSSRLSFWSLIGLLNRFARGGMGPLAGVPLELPSATVDLRAERGHRGQRAHSGRTSTSARATERPREPQSRERKPRRDPGERSQREPREPRARRQGGSDRPERAERPEGQRQPRSNRGRPAREQSEVSGNGATGPAPIETGLESGPPQVPAARKKRRRRRRRAEGGTPASGSAMATEADASVPDAETPETAEGPEANASQGETNGDAPKKRKSRRGGRGRRGRRGSARNTGATLDNNVVSDGVAPSTLEAPPPAPETGSVN